MLAECPFCPSVRHCLSHSFTTSSYYVQMLILSSGGSSRRTSPLAISRFGRGEVTVVEAKVTLAPRRARIRWLHFSRPNGHQGVPAGGLSQRCTAAGLLYFLSSQPVRQSHEGGQSSMSIATDQSARVDSKLILHRSSPQDNRYNETPLAP